MLLFVVVVVDDVVVEDGPRVVDALDHMILVARFAHTNVSHALDVDGAQIARNTTDLNMDWEFVHRDERDHGAILADDKERWLESGFAREIQGGRVRHRAFERDAFERDAFERDAFERDAFERDAFEREIQPSAAQRSSLSDQYLYI